MGRKNATGKRAKRSVSRSEIIRIYTKAVFLLAFLVFSCCFALPYLFSAKSDELVVGGVLYCVIALPVIFFSAKSILQKKRSFK